MEAKDARKADATGRHETEKIDLLKGVPFRFCLFGFGFVCLCIFFPYRSLYDYNHNVLSSDAVM
jgi:hypothetical protein